ncbi:hypothetical protein [Nannocystis radixulma]|nr:hypothetical protein [Nannocystis radixulma]
MERRIQSPDHLVSPLSRSWTRPRSRSVAAALLLGGLMLPQKAMAAPAPCNAPEMGLEPALGQYASVGLDPGLESELDAHLSDIVTQQPGEPAQITKGAVVMVARHSKVVYAKRSGCATATPSPAATRRSSCRRTPSSTSSR